MLELAMFSLFPSCFCIFTENNFYSPNEKNILGPCIQSLGVYGTERSPNGRFSCRGMLDFYEFHGFGTGKS